MTTEELLSKLCSLDVTLWAEGNRLRYSAPKGVLTPDLREELFKRKTEILSLVGQRKVRVSFDPQPILPVSREMELPLSFAQQRLWFLNQLTPGSSAYNIPIAYRVTGRLNVTALKQSLNEIIRRHEVLRTTFAVVEGRPIQVVAPSLSLTVSVKDMRELPSTQRDTKARSCAVEEAHRAFDLAQGPLLRATLLRLGDEDHMFLLTMHHIISDGWSIALFNRELSALYEAFSVGKRSPLPELTIQYADFAVWQRQRLQGEVLDSQLSYWKQQLGGDIRALHLPTDRPSQEVQSFIGTHQNIVLSKPLTRALKALSRSEGVTLFMTMLAALKTLLYRYTRQEDILVGTPIANRNRTEIEGLIGFFINTLVLRTDLSGRLCFRELLARVREVTLGAYAHQDLPFEKLVEELQPERDLNRTPLFDILFNFVSTPQTLPRLPGCTISLEKQEEPESKFMLTLYAKEREGELHLDLVYRRALFSPERIACFLDQFLYLLEQIVDAPEKPIDAYSLVTTESRRLLPDASAALTEPQFEPITNTFAAWANRTPEQTAVSQDNRIWTYRALAESAQTLAHTLLAQGLKRGDPVAIVGPRSFGLIAGMLGALFSGGVLLPIDQNLPTNRQRLMLQEARTKFLVCIMKQRREAEWLHELPSIVKTNIDPDSGCIVGPEKNLEPQIIPLPDLASDDAAYLFFTSGTTGVPKGVLGCHKGLSHFLHWQRETFPINPQDRSAQLTALSFDVVLRDIFLCLTSGATLCLPETPDEFTPGRILPWLERERISLLHTVPTLAQTWLIDVPEGVSLRNLRWVFFAGEPLSEVLVRRWRKTFPRAGGIVNLYGPTETTLAKCFYIVPSDVSPGMQPVGRPLPETQALILTEAGQMCGIGEPGEIVIRTPFRSLGYINAPDEVRKHFVKNPLSNNEQDVVYSTGDLGRYRPDGSLDIIGRVDHQIKIRGVRVEPEEITAILSQHPDVQSCVVIGRKDEEGQASLIAYVVTSSQKKVTIHELRSYLIKQLPAIMVPSHFVFMEQLPVTANGKVDRQALPSLDMARPRLGRVFVGPRTHTERILAHIWADLLGIDQVGIHDNFFELGGDSLLSLRMIATANKAGLRFTLNQLFAHQTIAELAAVWSWTTIPQAEQGLVTGPIPILPDQCYLLENESIKPHHMTSTKLLEVRQALDASSWERVVEQLLLHHDALRLRFFTETTGWNQFIAAPDGILPFSWIDLSKLPEEEQRLAIESAAVQLQKSLNLSEGPIMRVAYFDLGAQESGRLLIIVHHLAIDGVSWGILLHDLETACQQVRRGEPIQLPPKTTSIKGWAERLMEYQQSVALRQELTYWTAEHWAWGARLPVDYPEGRHKNTRSSDREVSVSLSAQETRALHDAQKTHHVQTIEVLLAALAQSLAWWTGERIFQIDLTRHGRVTLFEDMDLSHTVGLFVDVHPVLLKLGRIGTVGDVLKSVREQFRSIPNEGFGYGLLRYLVKDTEIVKRLCALPQSEVGFNYTGESVFESPLFRLIKEAVGLNFGPEGKRFYLLEIFGYIIDGQLRLVIAYSENIHKKATIERLAQELIQALRSLIISI